MKGRTVAMIVRCGRCLNEWLWDGQPGNYGLCPSCVDAAARHRQATDAEFATSADRVVSKRRGLAEMTAQCDDQRRPT